MATLKNRDDIIKSIKDRWKVIESDFEKAISYRYINKEEFYERSTRNLIDFVYIPNDNKNKCDCGKRIDDKSNTNFCKNCGRIIFRFDEKPRWKDPFSAYLDIVFEILKETNEK